jgi:hypothetical protein
MPAMSMSGFEGDCGGSGGVDMSYSWTPAATGTHCIDTRGSDYDTVVRLFDAECGEETACDDDGSEWIGYASDLTSMVEAEMVAGETVVVVVDAYSSYTTAGSFMLNVTEGGCPDVGTTCTTAEGADGVYDCDENCIEASTLGDGFCDASLECSAFDFDEGDCDVPAIGDECTYGDYGSTGIYNCDLECGSSWSLGSGYACDEVFDCEELDYDMGDCIDIGDECMLDDGTMGIYGCDSMTCVEDSLGDGTCDLALECADFEYDSGDCEAPDIGGACETTDWSGEIVEGILDCSGDCSTYTDWLGDGWCDSIFDCEETDYDGGDCAP